MRDTVTQTEIRHARRTERTDGRRWGLRGCHEGVESGRQTATERTSATRGWARRGLYRSRWLRIVLSTPWSPASNVDEGGNASPYHSGGPLLFFALFFLSLTIGGHANTRTHSLDERVRRSGKVQERERERQEEWEDRSAVTSVIRLSPRRRFHVNRGWTTETRPLWFAIDGLPGKSASCRLTLLLSKTMQDCTRSDFTVIERELSLRNPKQFSKVSGN